MRRVHLDILFLTIALLLQSCNMPEPTPLPAGGEVPVISVTLYVTVDGDDGNDCLTETTACRTIVGAMLKASYTSTIIIGPGTFYTPAGGTYTLGYPTTFRGAGMDATILLEDSTSTIFRVSDPVRVVIQDLTIGRTSPGGRSTWGVEIRDPAAEVTLENCRVSNHGNGIVVSAGATVTVRNCRIERNQYGISNLGNLTVENATITENAIEYGAALSNIGDARVTDTDIVRNGAFNSTSGAGTPAVVSEGTLSMQNVEISDNIAYGLSIHDGSATLTNVDVKNNGNAGIWLQQGSLTGEGLIVQDNGSYGVDIGGRSGSTVGTVDLSRSAIVGNHSAGLRFEVGDVHLQNVTISGNQATSSGGGGIWAYGGNLIMLDSTVAFNNGHGLEASVPGGTITIRRSVIALNSSDECLVSSRYPASYVPPTFTCVETWTAATLGLGPLTEESGTLVHPLQAGSPLVDAAGPPAGCPAVDQRGAPRPSGTTCDVGAYEQGSTAAPLTSASPEVATLVTDTPAPESGLLTFITDVNANCRQGPSTDYEVMDAYLAGQQLAVEGRNEAGSWFWVLQPGSSDKHCWVAGSTGKASGSYELVQVVAAPPLPKPQPQAGESGGDPDQPPPQQQSQQPPQQAGPPPAPEKFNLATKSCSANGYVVALNWLDVDGEDGYRVYRDGQVIATLGKNAAGYDDNSPDFNGHSYKVEAFNAGGANASGALKSEGCLY